MQLYTETRCTGNQDRPPFLFVIATFLVPAEAEKAFHLAVSLTFPHN